MIFAQVPCQSETERAEVVEVKLNQVGSLASPSEIEEMRREQSQRGEGRKPKIVYDSSGEEQHTHTGRLKRRLRESQEAVNEISGDIESLREVRGYDVNRRLRENERRLNKE